MKPCKNIQVHIEEVVNIFHEFLKNREINIQFICKNDNFKEIEGDWELFKLVLFNLVYNGAKFNSIKGDLVFVYWLEEDKYLCMDIADSGIGIEKDQIPHLFNLLSEIKE
jgi:signal transduction histidine kinase